MRKLILLLSIASVMLPIVFFNACEPSPCSGGYMAFTPVIYDTFMLADSNLDWKYDTNLKMVDFIDPNNQTITFFKPMTYGTDYSSFSIESVDYDKENCIRNGSNQVYLQSESESWYSVNSPVVIYLSRKAMAFRPDIFILDSLKYYHVGESYGLRFENPFGSFGIPEEKYEYSYGRSKMEQLDSVTLNNIKWKDVTHVYYFKNPDIPYSVYIKGVYLKKGTGLICFYSSDNRYWYLKI